MKRTTNLFLSGQRVPSGIYRSLFSGAEIRQNRGSLLPRQNDGSRALYVRLTQTEGGVPAPDTAKTNRIPQVFASSERKSGR